MALDLRAIVSALDRAFVAERQTLATVEVRVQERLSSAPDRVRALAAK